MKVSAALREFPAISLKGKDQKVLATPPNCLESYPLERKNKPPEAKGRGVLFFHFSEERTHLSTLRNKSQAHSSSAFTSRRLPNFCIMVS